MFPSGMKITHRHSRKKDFAERGFVVALLASFVLSPTAPAFAQSADAIPTTPPAAIISGPAPSDTSSVASPVTGAAPIAAPSVSAPTPSTDAPSIPPTANAPSMADSAPSQPTIAAPSTPAPTPNSPVVSPKGGTAPQASASPSGNTAAPSEQPVAYNSFGQNRLQVNKNTGALGMTYPIDIPPGRNNLQPDVNLTYNSQDNQFGNIFGEGWSVNIPSIQRLNKAGVDKLYSTSTLNYFSSSLDGELVATTTVSSTGVAYVPRTENGAFNQYAFSSSSNQWVMTDKKGTQYTFGSTADSQQNDPNKTANVFKWMLKQVTDTNQNTIVYSYFKDAGQIYPSSTIYTGNGSSTGMFEVDFLRGSSSDNATSSATGFGVKSNYRVNEIDALVNGSWVRKYALAYTTGSNGSSALLGSITESGRNSAGMVVTLPASVFSYQAQATGWTASSTWNSPVPFLDWRNNSTNGAVIMNAYGDDYADILQGITDQTNASDTAIGYINNGSGWGSSSTWNPPVAFLDWYNNSSNGVQAVDVNNDGLTDILQGIGDHTNASDTYAAWINTGSGWTSSSTWNPPAALLDWYNGTDNGVRVVDVNGDGLPDILQGITNQRNGATTTLAAWINNGHGWTRDDSWAPPVAFLDWYNSADTGWRIADVNGDGLPDIVSSAGAYINNGHGWTYDASWTSPIGFWDTNSHNDAGARIADVNGDGLPDLLQSVGANPNGNTNIAYLNTGHGWASSSAWISPTSFLDWQNTTDNGVRIADVNGDGLPDILQNVTDNPNGNTNAAYINNGTRRADLLTGIAYPQGGSSSIAYQSATQYLNGGVIASHEPYPVYVVSQVANNDGAQAIASTTYQYSGGTRYYGSPTDQQFAGFGVVTEADPAGNVTKTYYHTESGTDSAHGEYADNFWKIGKPYRVENYDNAGNVFKVVVNKWDSASLGGNAAFAKLVQSVQLDYDRLSTHKDSAEMYSYDNATGNQTQKIQWGQVSANTDGSFTDTGTDDYTTNTTYATSATGVIGKPSDVIMTDHNSNKVKETQYFYDNLSLGSASAGNLTKEQDWKTGSTYVTAVRNIVNSYGLVTQSLDPRNNTTTYAYDTYNLYPATTTNPYGRTNGYQYDYSTGKITQVSDWVGNLSQTLYDGAGRTLAVLETDVNNHLGVVTSTAYAYTDTANAVSVHQSDYLNATTSVDAYAYYDGLGRLIQTRKSAEDAGTYKVTDRAYNNLGLLQKESLPYFGSGSAKTSATTTAALFANYTYDALGRPVTVANAVGTTTNSYTNWKAATTDPRGKEKDLYDDAYGNLVQVDEHNGTSTYSTYYAYDGLHDLLSLTDAVGNVRNFTYDGLGRRLTAQDLHAATTTTYGTWNYSYDDAGNLTQTIDPNNLTTTYVYEKLNRISTEAYSGHSGNAASYAYDAYGKPRLVAGVTSGGSITYIYNTVGQVSQETTRVSSISYVTSYTYDRQGNRLTITNPDNSVVRYTYNLAGLPETVAYQPSGGSVANVITNIDYAPTDQPVTIAYANGVTMTNTYDAAHRYRLSQKVSTLPGGSNAQNIAYTYDADGNITQTADTSVSGAAKTVNYTYDDLLRLTIASTTNASTTNFLQNFSYDALGNILSGPAGTYFYGPTPSSTYADPDAATGITVGTTTAPFIYDNNGNLISSNGGTYTWNYHNWLVQSVTANGTSTYSYNYAGNRLKLVEGSTTTVFPTTLYNVMADGTATTTTKHVFAGELLLAAVTDATVATTTTSSVRYVLDDSLSGSNVVTDASGTIVETLDYYPYGAAKLDTKAGSYAGEKRKFDGMERDSSTGLDYAMARYYDNTRGQFISEDPSFLTIGDPNQVKQNTNQDQQAYLSDPQQLNAYSYGRDNPITQKDPNGKFAITAAIPFLALPEISLSGFAGPLGVIGAAALAPIAIPATQWALSGPDAAMKQTTQPTFIKYNDQRPMRFVPTPGIQLPGASDGSFDNKPPNIDPKSPTWIRWAAGCAIVCPHVGEIIQEIKDLKDWTQSFNQQSQPTQDQKAATTIDPAQPTSIISASNNQTVDQSGNIIRR